MDKKDEVYNILKQYKDVDPDKHDGSYELVRETVKSYAGLNDLNSVTFADIDLIYLMAIIQTDKKRNSKCIDNSSLPDSEKERLHSVLDNVWERANNHEYENIAKSPLSIGMFGTGFYTFNKPTSDSNLPVIVIKALVNIYNNTDAQTIYRNLKNDIGNKVKGISVPSFSVMAHCLKPNIFPIINKNEGFGNIFETLGITLHKQKNISNYVDCCIAISNYKNANFNFNNYRVMDLVARNMISIDYIKVLEYCENNVNLQYEDPKNVTDPNRKADLIKIKENGQEATDIMKQMCEACSNLYNLKPCGQVKWLDASNKKTRDYLWARMRYQGYEDDAESISIKCQKSGNVYEFSFEVEVENEMVKHDHKLLDRHHKLLDIPLKPEDNLVYITGTNELKNIASINETVANLKSRIASGQIDKVKVGRVIRHEPKYSNKDYYNAMVEGVGALIPFYEHIIGVNNGTNATNGNSNNSNKKVQTIMKNNIVGLNTILYGPPGTGKTYNSRTYAVAICEFGGDINAAKALDYDTEIIPRYNALVKSGHIRFTTFHQSYGYEEFIEGIKPSVEEETGQVSYPVKDGCFKDFCIAADKPFVTSTNPLYDPDATVYKISMLDDDRKQHLIKDECFKEGYARLDFSSEPGKAKRILDKLQEGDFVLSFKTRETIDGIGVVKSSLTIENIPGKTVFTTGKEVDWILPNVDINILKYNANKKLSRATVHRLPSMNTSTIVQMINDNGKNVTNVSVQKNTDKYVFIIDEINRGNISKIFGELITLIEPSKRKGKKEAMECVLPYSGDPFSIPDNVYILGTMNTADRSIALMDTALRRRFDFVEMMPDIEPIKGLKVKGLKDDIEIDRMLDAMNKRIEILYDREHTLGHAFFMKLTEANENTVENLASIFKNKIIPLLQEYFYEDYEKIRLVLGDNAKPEANQFIKKVEIKTDVFKGNVSKDDIEKQYRYEINIPKDQNAVDPFMEEDSYKLIY